jgi:hypothetical protein
MITQLQDLAERLEAQAQLHSHTVPEAAQLIRAAAVHVLLAIQKIQDQAKA